MTIKLKNQIMEIEDLDFSPIDEGEILFDYEGKTYCISLPNFDPDDYENYELPTQLLVFDNDTCTFIDTITLDTEQLDYIKECISENLEFDEDYD